VNGFRDFRKGTWFLVKGRSFRQHHQSRIYEEHMDMNLRKTLISLAVAVALILTGTSAFADPHQGMPPHHGMFHTMGLSGLTGTQQHLYVLAGGKIMQYSLADLKLLKAVDLPKPVPPADKSTGKEEAGKFPPPPPPHLPGPHGLWAGDGALYVLAGPMIYQFSTPDLTLKTKVELPKPEFPKAGH
jgi:hypothetical protein